MSDPALAAPRPSWAEGPAAKLGLALLLILVLQVPLFAVSSLIDERQGRQDQVVAGIGRSWGPPQAIVGPTLAIPYEWVDPPVGSYPAQRRQGWIQVPASSVAIDADVAPETRQRGLFHATVYAAAVRIEGVIDVPAIEVKDVPNPQLHWDGAVLAIGATDLRGQPAGGTLTVNARALPFTVQRGSGACGGVVSVPAGLSAAPAPGTKLTLAGRLALRGTQSIAVEPWGQQIAMRISAPWQTPSFSGAALPLAYTIGHEGFRANWDISGDAASSSWRRGTDILPECGTFDADTQVGVDLIEAVPTYQMVTRAAKYGTLFLVLSFVTYFLIEQGTGLRIHLAQYALLGLSVSLFALLLVAVAEPLGFNAGYLVSTGAVMAQASLYTLSVTRRPRLAMLFAGVLAALFGVLYVVLRLESYALLAGTATVFVVLSVVMAATRRLDWSRGRMAL